MVECFCEGVWNKFIVIIGYKNKIYSLVLKIQIAITPTYSIKNQELLKRF